jgi:TolB-like protein/tetratricopeptide (TPR) repeat protein
MSEPGGGKPLGFFGELRRRKVVRVAIVYVPVAFAVVEMADLGFPRLDLPDWSVTFVLMLALLGLPVALGLAWAFDVTAEGIQRTGRKAGRGNAAAMHSAAPDARWISRRSLVMATLAAAVGLGVGFFARTPPGLGRDLRSIAVLPFDNFAAGEDNALFTAGIHEEVITELSRISDLKVISRSSVMGYANSRPNLRQIGRELGVATILEGSVRREANMFRVTVQLIDAETDKHLWAENFDETITGILDLQSRIATRIARQLRASLTTGEATALNDLGTRNARAYERWVLGQALYEESRLHGDPRAQLRDRAEAEFRAALALDPGFAWAAASLAGTMGNRRPGQSSEAYLARLDTVRTLLANALTRAPDDPWLRWRRGVFLSVAEADEYNLEESLAEYQRALKGFPGSAELHYLIGSTLARLGRWEEGFQAARRAAELDPRSPRVLVEASDAAMWARQYDEAERLLTRAAALSPPGGLSRRVQFNLLSLDLRRGLLDTASLRHVDAWLAAEPLTPVQIASGLISERPEVLLLTDRFDAMVLALAPTAHDPGARCDCFNAKAWVHRVRGREANARAAWDSLSAAMAGLAWDTPDAEANFRAQMARNHARAGRRSEALRDLTRVAQLRMSETMRQTVSYRRAQTYAELREMDMLVAELEDLLATPSQVSPGALRTYAAFMHVRNHPDFQALMARHPLQ